MEASQRLKGKPVSPIKGILAIIGIIASILIVSFLEKLIKEVTGLQYASMAVWLIVVVEAVMVMRNTNLEYGYYVAGGRFSVTRGYGSNQRPIYDIPGEDIIAFGEKDEIFKQYGNGQTFDSATINDKTLKQMAMVYRKSKDETQLLVLQPNESIIQSIYSMISKEDEDAKL